PERIPVGGAPRAYLGKASTQDFALAWFQPPQVDPSGLDAAGIPQGWSPTANGGGGWDWERNVADADDIEDGMNKVVMTTVERIKLGSLTRDYTELDNLPDLGTASALDVEQVLQPEGVD